MEWLLPLRIPIGGIVPSGLRRAILTTEKAPYRVVILKQRFPALSRKTIVRRTVKCIVLTIVDSDVLKDGS